MMIALLQLLHRPASSCILYNNKKKKNEEKKKKQNKTECKYEYEYVLSLSGSKGWDVQNGYKSE